MSSNSNSMNINEASKACGLSPSVLRIWELRYGWPNPKRKANGYRAYNQHQVQELKRVAELVKSGTPISSLIIDGLPRWPTDLTHRRPPVGLDKARALPKPAGSQEAKLQQELIDGLERRHANLVRELLQRSFWSVRPDDEVLTSLAPTIVGLEELALAERPLNEEAELRQLVKERCVQLLRRFKSDPTALRVVPVANADQALAGVVVLALNQRGEHAQLWLHEESPADGPMLLAGDHQDANAGKGDRRVVGRVSSLGGGEGMVSLAEILAGAFHPTMSA